MHEDGITELDLAIKVHRSNIRVAERDGSKGEAKRLLKRILSLEDSRSVLLRDADERTKV